MLLGTIMILNVWGVIWRNQKVVLANAANVVAGGEAEPGCCRSRPQGAHGVAAELVFSVTMLFFMVFTRTARPRRRSVEQRQDGRLSGRSPSSSSPCSN